MAIEIRSLAPTSDEVYKKWLFYGGPGKGKTRAAVAFLKRLLKEDPKARAMWLDIDGKLEEDEGLEPEVRAAIDVWTPPTRLLEGEIGVARIAIDKRPSTQDYIPKNPRGYLEIVDAINELDRRANKKEYPWKLTVLDTITSVVDHLLPLICSHHNASTMSTPMWGVFGNNMLMLRRGFLSLPGHRIIIAHTRTVEDETTKEINVFPSVPGQTGENMAKDFNEVYFFQGKDPAKPTGPYTVITNANRKYQARSTKPGIAQVISIEEMVQRM